MTRRFTSLVHRCIAKIGLAAEALKSQGIIRRSVKLMHVGRCKNTTPTFEPMRK